MRIAKHHSIILALLVGVASCVNEVSPVMPIAIVGKWKVMKDSINFGGFASNYVKSDTDYYNFQSNGNLIVKEGGVIDSATYSLTPGNSINIVYKKNALLKFIAIDGGVVVKDSILNRFSKTFQVSDLSVHSAKLSALFYWKVASPPIVEGSTTIDSLKVSAITVLSK